MSGRIIQPRGGIVQVTGLARAMGRYSMEAYDRHGRLKWESVVENIIPNAALDHILDVVLSGGSQLTTWYMGLTDATPTAAAGDTMASHAGWSELTGYSAANRPAWTDAGVSGQSVTNSASKASFAINASITVGGLFLVSNNTKGGSSGVLYSVGAAQEGNRSLVDGDTLNCTGTFTMASA